MSLGMPVTTCGTQLGKGIITLISFCYRATNTSPPTNKRMYIYNLLYKCEYRIA